MSWCILPKSWWPERSNCIGRCRKIGRQRGKISACVGVRQMLLEALSFELEALDLDKVLFVLRMQSAGLRALASLRVETTMIVAHFTRIFSYALKNKHYERRFMNAICKADGGCKIVVVSTSLVSVNCNSNSNHSTQKYMFIPVPLHSRFTNAIRYMHYTCFGINHSDL